MSLKSQVEYVRIGQLLKSYLKHIEVSISPEYPLTAG